MCFYPPIFFSSFKRPLFGTVFFTRQLEFLLHQLSRSAGDGDSDGEDIHRKFDMAEQLGTVSRKNGGVLRCRLNHEDIIHGYYMINLWIIWDMYIYIYHDLGKFHHDLTS